MKYLSKKQILKLHSRLIELSGGTDGVRDEGLLDSALHAPFQTFAGQDLYPTVIEKSVRLGFGLINNHPFLDGNKRTGTHVMLVVLSINGIEVDYDDNELIRVIYRVADGQMTEVELLKWMEKHIK